MWNLSSIISINDVINISKNKQLYTNTNTISDREIHVSRERRFKIIPYISNTYKG